MLPSWVLPDPAHKGTNLSSTDPLAVPMDDADTERKAWLISPRRPRTANAKVSRVHYNYYTWVMPYSRCLIHHYLRLALLSFDGITREDSGANQKSTQLPLRDWKLGDRTYGPYGIPGPLLHCTANWVGLIFRPDGNGNVGQTVAAYFLFETYWLLQ